MMCSRYVLVALLVAVLAYRGHGVDPKSEQYEIVRKEKPTGPLGDGYRGGLYSGRVTEITKTTVSLQRPGKAAFRFRLSPSLAAGELPKFVAEPGGPVPPEWLDIYLNVIADLRVGDIVQVEFSRWDQCDAFVIWKRPGGRVPPVRGENPKPGRARYHESVNWRQDYEEHGIPLPERFYGLAGSGRIAPMPHVVYPKIPYAEP